MYFNKHTLHRLPTLPRTIVVTRSSCIHPYSHCWVCTGSLHNRLYPLCLADPFCHLSSPSQVSKYRFKLSPALSPARRNSTSPWTRAIPGFTRGDRQLLGRSLSSHLHPLLLPPHPHPFYPDMGGGIRAPSHASGPGMKDKISCELSLSNAHHPARGPHGRMGSSAGA